MSFLRSTRIRMNLSNVRINSHSWGAAETVWIPFSVDGVDGNVIDKQLFHSKNRSLTSFERTCFLHTPHSFITLWPCGASNSSAPHQMKRRAKKWINVIMENFTCGNCRVTVEPVPKIIFKNEKQYFFLFCVRRPIGFDFKNAAGCVSFGWMFFRGRLIDPFDFRWQRMCEEPTAEMPYAVFENNTKLQFT